MRADRPGRAGKGRRRDRGASLIEFALVLPLLVMLLVGTVTAGITYGRHNSIQNAAREASRYAATLPGPIDATWLGSVRDVARAAGIGDLDSSVDGQFICVAYVDGANDTRLTDTGGVEAAEAVPCFNDGRPSGEPRVQVVTQRMSRIEIVVAHWDLTLNAGAAARFEREP